MAFSQWTEQQSRVQSTPLWGSKETDFLAADKLNASCRAQTTKIQHRKTKIPQVHLILKEEPQCFHSILITSPPPHLCSSVSSNSSSARLASCGVEARQKVAESWTSSTALWEEPSLRQTDRKSSSSPSLEAKHRHGNVCDQALNAATPIKQVRGHFSLRWNVCKISISWSFSSIFQHQLPLSLMSCVDKNSPNKTLLSFPTHDGDELTRGLCSCLWRSEAHPCRDKQRTIGGSDAFYLIWPPVKANQYI